MEMERERVFPARAARMEEAAAWLDGVMARADAPEKARAALLIALDEVFSNIVKYGGASALRLTAEATPRGLRLTFADDGAPFDPLSAAPPDLARAADERPEGGLGVFLVRELTDAQSYRREGGENIFSIEKDWKA